jgi:hypothetical protein
MGGFERPDDAPFTAAIQFLLQEVQQHGFQGPVFPLRGLQGPFDDVGHGR